MESRCESKRVILLCVQWRAELGTCAKEGSDFVAYLSEFKVLFSFQEVF